MTPIRPTAFPLLARPAEIELLREQLRSVHKQRSRVLWFKGDASEITSWIRREGDLDFNTTGASWRSPYLVYPVRRRQRKAKLVASSALTLTAVQFPYLEDPLQVVVTLGALTQVVSNATPSGGPDDLEASAPDLETRLRLRAREGKPLVLVLENIDRGGIAGQFVLDVLQTGFLSSVRNVLVVVNTRRPSNNLDLALETQLAQLADTTVEIEKMDENEAARISRTMLPRSVVKATLSTCQDLTTARLHLEILRDYAPTAVDTDVRSVLMGALRERLRVVATPSASAESLLTTLRILASSGDLCHMQIVREVIEHSLGFRADEVFKILEESHLLASAHDGPPVLSPNQLPPGLREVLELSTSEEEATRWATSFVELSGPLGDSRDPLYFLWLSAHLKRTADADADVEAVKRQSDALTAILAREFVTASMGRYGTNPPSFYSPDQAMMLATNLQNLINNHGIHLTIEQRVDAYTWIRRAANHAELPLIEFGAELMQVQAEANTISAARFDLSEVEMETAQASYASTMREIVAYAAELQDAFGGDHVRQALEAACNVGCLVDSPSMVDFYVSLQVEFFGPDSIDDSTLMYLALIETDPQILVAETTELMPSLSPFYAGRLAAQTAVRLARSGDIAEAARFARIATEYSSLPIGMDCYCRLIFAIAYFLQRRLSNARRELQFVLVSTGGAFPGEMVSIPGSREMLTALQVSTDI